MRGPIDKQCERCGDTFTCGQYGCWCGQVALTDGQFDWISGRYEDCLCPACLKAVNAGIVGPGMPEVERKQSDA